MSDVRPIRELLVEVEELRGVLDDLNVKYVRIAANGHWSYEKLGRARHGREVLERGLLLRLAELIPPGRHLRSGEWAVRKYEGVSGPSILIERLPIAVADRLPQEVLATLKRQVKQPGNGVLVGEPGGGKGGLLLWLALQIPDQPVLYVAENPPSEFPGTHVMHVFPPSTDAERRSLERFVRLSPTVMWDRVVRMDDLQTLYGFPGAGRRWFTTDASSVRSALRLLTAAVQVGCDARFSTLLHLASSVIGRPEARNLLVREENGWSEVWAAQDSVLDLLDAYDSSDLRRLSPTEVSVPGIDLNLPKVEVAEDFVAEAEMVAEPVMVTSSAPPMGIPRRPPTEPPSTIEVDIDVDEYEKNDAVTGMLPRAEILELREQGMVPEDSGEIPALRAEAVAERTKAYVETPTELMGSEATNPAAYLTSIMPPMDDDDDDEDVPEINLEDLRITTMEELDDDNRQILEDVDDLARQFSDVFESDLDFDSLAEEMLSEISEVDDLAMEETAMTTNPSRLVIIDSPPARRVDDTDDSDANHTLAGGAEILRMAERMAQDSEDREDSTKEFTLNERLSLLRKRRTDE